jgi:hypothetical protein
METVVVVPTVGNDADADPVAQGAPLVLTPWEVEPGNTAMKYGQGGDLTDIEFTVYFGLRTLSGGGYEDTASLVKDGDEIHIRGRRCTAMVQIWTSQRSRLGGVVVLARSRSGKSA